MTEAHVRAVLGILWLLGASIFCSPAGAQSAIVALSKHPGKGVVRAHFTLSEPTTTLRFAGGGNLRRLTWTFDGAGATLSPDGLEIAFSTPTRTFGVLLRPDVADGQFDRTYTPIVAFNSGGACAVFTDYLLPKSGGSVHVVGPGLKGGRRTDGTRRSIWRANDAPVYLVVGTADVDATELRALTIDPQMPPWIGDSLERSVTSILAQYAAATGTRPKEQPWILATYQSQRRPDQPAFRGDVSAGVIRLNLIGPQWSDFDGELEYRLNAFVAHELFHLWNRSLWNVAAPSLVWLFEGGAEAAAHDALRMFSGDRRRYEREISISLTRCATARGLTLNDKLAGQGKTAYDCGASIFHLASTVASDFSPLRLWAAMFERQRQSRTYSADDLLAILSTATGRPNALETLVRLVKSEAVWTETLRDKREVFGLRFPSAIEIEQTPFAELVLDDLVFALVKNDCRGAISVAYERQTYSIDALPDCRRIKAPISATAVQGVNMREDPGNALRRALAQCARGDEVEFSDRNGRSLLLSCEGWKPSVDGLLFVKASE